MKPMFVALVALLTAPARAEEPREGFTFGSYGRIGAGTDLRGSTPEAVAVVAHGARVVERSYLELDLAYRFREHARVVTTAALFGDPFHYTGQTGQALAIRNLFLEVAHGRARGWAGSRMVRGDDIYLLDYWPLDNTNVLGGGASLTLGQVDLAAHVGVNRLLDPFQFQEDEVAAPGYGSATIVTMDRQRYVAGLASTYRACPRAGWPSWKGKGYLEVQGLAAGTRERQDGTREALPADFGWTLGGQLGAWGFARGASHANLFARWSQGLTAYDLLSAPFDLDTHRKAFPGASELVLGASANLELRRAGVLIGGYLRRFVGAGPSEDPASGWEYILDARPYVALGGPLQAAIDVSYQQRFPRGISPTALDALDPAIFQIAPMLLVSPRGAGSYSRPQLRVVYRAAHLDAGARDQYPLDDPRRDHAWVHYLGVQAEWWFNSNSYQ